MNKIFSGFVLLFFLSIFCYSWCGCAKKDQERQYDETVLETPKSVASDNAFLWQVPTGWKEEPASGMRIATFRLAGNPDEIDVSIVSLGGMAGGLEANLARWATQLNIKLAADQDLPKLISNAEIISLPNGSKAKIFDFTRLQGGQDLSTKSMIAAMINFDDTTVFVKMTGSIDAVKNHERSFQALLQSIQPKGQ